jgi:serine/threonine protein phosphatase 1
MAKTFVLGDVHGAHRALLQCLERASFRPAEDRLIFLGDVCDGWPDTRACIDELLKVNDLVYVLGNHDWWMLEWIREGKVDDLWWSQGGKATIDSYAKDSVPDSHLRLLLSAVPYFVVDTKLFVHAGIIKDLPLDAQPPHTFLWDRSFAREVSQFANNTEKKFTVFDEVYLGHTPITGGVPLRCGEVWMMDTGAGWSGTLSMMDIVSKESFISDPVPSLYPGVSGRFKK